MSLDHPRRKLWKSSSKTLEVIQFCDVVCRLQLISYMFTFIYRLWPLTTACCMLKVMKKKKWQRNPSRRRFAKIDQPNYRSASTLLLEYWCRLWIRLVAFWNPGWKKKCEKTLSQLHIVYFSLESKCKYMEESEFVCDSPHVHNEVDNIWWPTPLPVVRVIWWRTQLPGVTRNRCNAETL